MPAYIHHDEVLNQLILVIYMYNSVQISNVSLVAMVLDFVLLLFDVEQNW